MIRQKHTQACEKMVAEAVQDVAADLRLVDLADYVAFVRLELFGNIADIVASAAELFFLPGALAFGGSAAVRVDWNGEPLVSLDMRLKGDGATIYFRLGLGATQAEVDVTYVSFDAPLPDPADDTQVLDDALRSVRLKPIVAPSALHALSDAAASNPSP